MVNCLNKLSTRMGCRRKGTWPLNFIKLIHWPLLLSTYSFYSLLYSCLISSAPELRQSSNRLPMQSNTCTRSTLFIAMLRSVRRECLSTLRCYYRINIMTSRPWRTYLSFTSILLLMCLVQPENILLTDDDKVQAKLADFGLANVFGTRNSYWHVS